MSAVVPNADYFKPIILKFKNSFMVAVVGKYPQWECDIVIDIDHTVRVITLRTVQFTQFLLL